MVISRLRKVFKGSKGLWELLTRKKVNTDFITKDDLKTYKKILTVTNTRLTRYQPDGNIHITRGKKISYCPCALFAKPKGRGVESALLHNWTKYLWLILADYIMIKEDRPGVKFAEASGSCGEESYTTICRRYQGVVRGKWCQYVTQNCEEVFRA